MKQDKEKPANTDRSSPVRLSRSQCRRLRDYYRSAGWPCLDVMEVELLNAGLIERVKAAAGAQETLRVTEAGLQAIGVGVVRNRKAFDAHELLVMDTARHLAGTGRLVYRNLSLRGRVENGWKLCKPDVYSIRHTSVAAYARPMIHEIKVRRADLLSDLKRPEKRAAYQALSSEFFYVMPTGLADAHEVPEDCGVLYRGEGGFELARPASRRAMELSLAEWMALARRAAEFLEPDQSQSLLRGEDGNDPADQND